MLQLADMPSHPAKVPEPHSRDLHELQVSLVIRKLCENARLPFNDKAHPILVVTDCRHTSQR